MDQSRKRKIITAGVVVLVSLLAFYILFSTLESQNRSVEYFHTTFKEHFEEGLYASVYVSNYEVRVTYKPGTVINGVTYGANAQRGNPARYYDTAFYAPSRTLVTDYLNQAYANDTTGILQQTTVTYSDPNANAWMSYLPTLFLIGGSVFAVLFLIRAMNRQNASNVDFGKSQARIVKNIKVRFSDVAGAEEEKEELREVVDFLKQPKKFLDVGARIPRGVLLVGPPGTGKTLFAKAVAGEAGVPFFSLSGSDFVEMFVGVGASRVRDVFNQAKANMPAIIFIDEIDAVGRQRGAGLGGGHDEREQTLNQLLVEMDGFETNTSVIVMAATNRADILDPALLRPGRFDRQVYVNRPDVRGREAILKVHSRGKPLAGDVDFKALARITVGFTGADLENLLNEAAILAVRAGRTIITQDDLNEGLNKVEMGPAKKSRLVTEPDKRITAYHEAGHAILANSLKYCDPVHEVTIIPRGMAAGYTMTRPDNDDNHVSKQKLLDRITMTLGGRVAEELVIQNISTGASADIKSITSTAHSMVVEWGMSEKLGPLYYGSEGEVFLGRNYQQHTSYSEKVAGLIDEEIRAIVESCHKRATEILTEKMDVLHNMARVLFEKETIHAEEMEMLMQGKSVKEVCQYIDEHQAKLEDMKVANQPTTKEEAQPQKVDEQANQQSQQVDQHENDQQN
ncbi:MAG: ATP-dependent zinc metalloprotease FtsH [Clostridia bacterium]|nr:ATP-dependent zinc metalloprotease FtsH [Clostridia bacterium]